MLRSLAELNYLETTSSCEAMESVSGHLPDVAGRLWNACAVAVGDQYEQQQCR